jgi:hypothetical protein
MRIEAPRTEDTPTGRRALARIVWEGKHKGPDLLWYETDAAFAADFEPAPEAFLVAALPLACGLGEPRLAIEGRACARLKANLESAMRVLSRWYPWCHEIPVEATDGFVARTPRDPPRAAAFVSGGVDSLSQVRANRLTYPLDHPASMRDGIHLFGWGPGDLVASVPHPERLRVSAEQRVRLEALGAKIDLTIVPIRTNGMAFHPRGPWSRDAGWGAGFISAAHLFPRRWSEAHFASSGDAIDAFPHGSHPLLDPLWSSAAVEVRHGEPCLTRTEKVEVVADWPEGMEALQVCVMHAIPPPGQVNCGRCEKCLRTLLGLLVLGRLDRARTFAKRDVTPDDIAHLRISGAYQRKFAAETALGLEARGRADLARTVRAKSRESTWRDARRRIRRPIRRAWDRIRGRDAPPGPAM